jgi:hypothetical protein
VVLTGFCACVVTVAVVDVGEGALACRVGASR